MTTPAQAEIVADHVEDARRKGARVLTGGKRKEGPGDWYEPTVIADADHSMKVMTEETFGPVVPVMKVADADEAVRMANGTRYGLSASVFAGSARRGEQIARRIEAGAVNVNDVLTTYFALGVPMGGWKESGIGFRHASYGIKKFVPPRVDRLAADQAGQVATRSGSPTRRRSASCSTGSPASPTPAASAGGSGSNPSSVGGGDELLADLLCGLDEVAQGGLGLGPGAGLQAAVRVDPELLGRQHARCGLQQLGHLAGRRNPR